MSDTQSQSASPRDPPSQGPPAVDIKMEDAPEDAPLEDAPSTAKEVKLEEELFMTDSEDELPDAKVYTPTSSNDEPQSQQPEPDQAERKASDPEILRAFYQRLFPWRHFFQWLNHSPVPTTDFTHREFAFMLENDACLRYQSYANSDLFRKDVVSIIPTRFDIGPVYSANPRDRKSLRHQTTFKPVAKELCFDIDLTDYDEIRTCCAKANICGKCWTFATMAIEVMDAALREDFGFRHIMWVYSGRRGVHAWVCDKAARTMNDQQRRAVVGYLDMIKGGAQSGKKVNVSRPLHRHLRRSMGILKPYFSENILRDQDPWATPQGAEALLNLLPNKTLVDSLRAEWASSDRPSAQRWSDIRTVNLGTSKRTTTTRKAEDKIREAMEDVVFEYTYPRIDINVSKSLNHLLKSPFVIHPGTGRVCVPIDTARLREFDPLSVPTVHSLLREIDEWGGEGEKVADWEKTSLKPYVEYFRGFVGGLLKDEGGRAKREREGDEKMEF